MLKNVKLGNEKITHVTCFLAFSSVYVTNALFVCPVKYQDVVCVKKENTNYCSPHLFIHLPHSGTARLLLRLHSSSRDNPLVWVPTAAHQQDLQDPL